MNKSWKYFFILLLNFSILACDESSLVREIDLEKSEQLIESIDHLNIKSLVLSDQNLIIDDTLIVMNPDSLNSPIFYRHQMSLEEWESKKRLPKETLTKVLHLMNESSNNRIVKENKAYFFNEGGWIDSDFGKVYSKQELEGKAKDFKFGRVQEIKPFGEKQNWYVYYAD